MCAHGGVRAPAGKTLCLHSIVSLRSLVRARKRKVQPRCCTNMLELPLVDVEARCVAPDVAPPLRQEAGVHELPGAQVGDDVVAKAVRQGAQPVTRRGGVVLHGNGERPEAGGNGSDRRKIRLLLFWWYVIQIGTKRISAGPSRTCQASEPFTNRDQRTTLWSRFVLPTGTKFPSAYIYLAPAQL
jgi:hypothetical protein